MRFRLESIYRCLTTGDVCMRHPLRTQIPARHCGSPISVRLDKMSSLMQLKISIFYTAIIQGLCFCLMAHQNRGAVERMTAGEGTEECGATVVYHPNICSRRRNNRTCSCGGAFDDARATANTVSKMSTIPHHAPTLILACGRY